MAQGATGIESSISLSGASYSCFSVENTLPTKQNTKATIANIDTYAVIPQALVKTG